MNEKPLEYFLCANTSKGFISRFNALTAHKIYKKIYLLTGVPGCGKSTMINTLLKNSSSAHKEIIYCTQNPTSADGAVIGETVFLDATAPHTVTPCYPGVVEQVIDLFCACDYSALTQHKNEIIQLINSKKNKYEKARLELYNAHVLSGDADKTVLSSCNITSCESDMSKLLKKYIPKAGEKAMDTPRLISAFTHQGQITLNDTIPQQAGTIVVLKDEYQVLSGEMLSAIRLDALSKDWEIITLYDCLEPYFKIEGVIIPKLNLAFIKAAGMANNANIAEEITLTKHYGGDMERQSRRVENQYECAKVFYSKASERLSEINFIHNQLERLYQTAISFDKIDQITLALINEIL